MATAEHYEPWLSRFDARCPFEHAAEVLRHAVRRAQWAGAHGRDIPEPAEVQDEIALAAAMRADVKILSRDNCNGYCEMTGRRPPPWIDPGDAEKMLGLRRSGTSITEIAQQFREVPKHWIAGLFKRHGLSGSSRRPQPIVDGESKREHALRLHRRRKLRWRLSHGLGHPRRPYTEMERVMAKRADRKRARLNRDARETAGARRIRLDHENALARSRKAAARSAAQVGGHPGARSAE